MSTLAVKLLPVLLIFALGIILRRINLFTEEDADSFQKLVFYVALPASILVSITKIKLSLNTKKLAADDADNGIKKLNHKGSQVLLWDRRAQRDSSTAN